MNESTRKEHVLDEEVRSPFPVKEHKVVPYVIHRHKAEKAGEHYDYRLLIDDKAVSFATRKGFPKELGQKYLFVQTPDHTPDYMKFEGTIPEGYGKGTVEIAHHGDAIISSNPHKLDITIPDGPIAGRYLIVKTDKGHLAMKKAAPSYYWEAKDGMYSAKVPDHLWDNPDVIASHKIDGSSHIVSVNDAGTLGIVSVRKSVKGDLIIKDHALPHLRDLQIPKKYHGMVFRAEMHLPGQPFRTLAGILNSRPTKAVQNQEKLGRIHMAPFKVIKKPGGASADDMTYEEQLHLLKQFAHDVNSPVVKVPAFTKENKHKFYEDYVKTGGEGVVLGHGMQKGKSKLFKAKKQQEWNFRIVGSTEGTGQFAGKGIGAFIVADKDGTIVGKVGTGLTAKLRMDAKENPSRYKGRLIKVRAMEPTLFSIRNPSFVGFEIDSNEADKLHNTEEERILDLANKLNL